MQSKVFGKFVIRMPAGYISIGSLPLSIKIDKQCCIYCNILGMYFSQLYQIWFFQTLQKYYNITILWK